MMRRALLLMVVIIVAGCGRDATHDGHDHGSAKGEAEPLSITQWTEKHELFVEFPAPVAGKPVEYHAHVTSLDGFRPLTEGSFQVRWLTPAGVAAETKVDGVKRALPGAPVGGVGPREPFYSAYEAESGYRLDRDALRWWEVLCSAKVCVVWIVQVNAYLSGIIPSVEQAAIGRRMAETELDLLQLLEDA